MLGFDHSRKVVRLPQVPLSAGTNCKGCGAAQPPSGVCPQCALRLIDLALSSSTDDFPRLVKDPSDEQGVASSPPRMRYDHYEICRTAKGEVWELGRGAMGVTYKAMDTRLGCPVALKIINAHYLAGSHGRDRFEREARTAARLRHANIASVFHLGVGNEDCFYTMEFIEGETLEAHVRRLGALPCDVALEIVTQAARALHVAHQHHFIHRDIKPTNLMLVQSESDGTEENHCAGTLTVKVIDFGLVKMAAETEITGWTTLCQGYFAGTPFYAAPEQLDGGAVDARTDIYALGRCLWFMLAGHSDSMVALAEARESYPQFQRAALAEFSGTIPAAILALLRSMTAAAPEHRPQSAAQLLQQIQGTCAAIRRENQPLATRRDGNLRRLLGLSIVLLVATAGAGLVIYGPKNPVMVKESSTSLVSAPSLLKARVLYAEASELRSKLNSADNLRAIELFLKSIALVPEYAEAHAGLALAYLQNVVRFGAPANQLDSALASAQRSIALDPRLPAGYTALAGIRTIQGKHWEALGQYHRALEIDGQYAPAMRGFSLLWTMVGQPQRGLPWGKAATQVDPLTVSSWSAAADPCVDLCADEQAESFYRHCLQINPAWMPAHIGLMHLHLLQGNFALARQESAVAESIDPNLIQPLTIKAQIAFFEGKYDEAEMLYRQLLGRERDGRVHYYSSISYLSALGFLRCRAGDDGEGRALLKEAADLHLKDSEGPQAIYDLAAIRAIEGRKEEALSLLTQAVSSGWLDYRATRLDPRFEALRGQNSFERMLGALQTHAELMRAEAESLCSKPPLIADFPVRLPEM